MWFRIVPLLITLLALAGCAADTEKAVGARPSAIVAPPAPVPMRGPAEGFAGWAVVIVSGDWRSGQGVPSATFDNARRDLAAAFAAAGFSPANIRQFSANPDREVALARFGDVDSTLSRLMAQAGDGCLVYITSHGSTEGLLMGDALVRPAQMSRMLNTTCAGRPTVAVISACHSGIFIPALSAPNRLVVAAARADRSSFGCSEDDRYPYFDGCLLEELPAARDFPALAEAARSCVARREAAEGFQPSEPQISLGTSAAPTLQALRFNGR